MTAALNNWRMRFSDSIGGFSGGEARGRERRRRIREIAEKLDYRFRERWLVEASPQDGNLKVNKPRR